MILARTLGDDSLNTQAGDRYYQLICSSIIFFATVVAAAKSNLSIEVGMNDD
jgi:hypothetical protein